MHTSSDAGAEDCYDDWDDDEISDALDPDDDNDSWPDVEDCDDHDASVHPGATEVWYDGVDQDCDGASDYDQDGDGQQCMSCGIGGGTDCDDTDATVHPGATETCDGADEDCDGAADEGAGTPWYADVDGDGHGDASSSVSSCTQPPGYVSDNSDTCPLMVDGLAHTIGGGTCTCEPGWYPQYTQMSGSQVITGATQCEAGYYCPDGLSRQACAPGYFASQSGQISCSACTAGTSSSSSGSTLCTTCSTHSSSSSGAATCYDDWDDDDIPNTLDPDDDNDTVSDLEDGCAMGDIGWTSNPTTDNDGDGCRDATEDPDDDNDGVADATDCDDLDAAVHPGATEVWYDGVDQNCDGQNDFDQDLDGFVCSSCGIPGGDDCDDTDASVHPGSTEIWYDGVDQNCDGHSDFDQDFDGHDCMSCGAPGGDDCDDLDDTRYPGATEICDGEDDDCDSTIDEGVSPTWYADSDDDGYGDPSVSLSSCTQPPNYVDNGDDCDDGDESRHPGATETCDGEDDDCDGFLPADEIDDDGDGYVECPFTLGTWSGSVLVYGGYDCDDSRADVSPGDPEVCDAGNTDEDCDGFIDELAYTFYVDLDNDGYGSLSSGPPITLEGSCTSPPTTPPGRSLSSTDCNDQCSSCHPGGTENCDNADNDCDGSMDEDCDDDGDDWCDAAMSTSSSSTCPNGGGDCDDDCFTCHPLGTEVCDGTTRDEDCDGNYDDLDYTFYLDLDNDGYGSLSSGPPITLEGSCTSPPATPPGRSLSSTDCNDQCSSCHPGGTESCDNADNDCDGAMDEDCDDDGDDWCDAAMSTSSSSTCPNGGGDCDDDCFTCHPLGTEVCDGLDRDEDCSGSLDDPEYTFYLDNDGDGHGSLSSGAPITLTGTCSSPPPTPPGRSLTNTDCNDQCSSCFPGGTEVCDTEDDDCDGVVDDGVSMTWYADGDDDGYGDPSVSLSSCTQPPNYVDNGDDCDDTSDDRFPGAPELCDAMDNDCDFSIDALDTDLVLELCEDQDGACSASHKSSSMCVSGSWEICGASTYAGQNPLYEPNESRCDNTDNDCDGLADEDCDDDDDGYCDASMSTSSSSTCPGGGGDCDDADDTVHPGATETCDTTDEDCDGVADDGVSMTWYADSDGDGFGDASVTQSSCTQPPNYVDNDDDCDDLVTLYEDLDGDLHGTSTKVACGGVASSDDCDDADAAKYPGAVCDDDDGCTSSDVYTSSCTCSGTVVSCDDGVACTTDLCHQAGDCIAPDNGTGTADLPSPSCSYSSEGNLLVSAGLPPGVHLQTPGMFSDLQCNTMTCPGACTTGSPGMGEQTLRTSILHLHLQSTNMAVIDLDREITFQTCLGMSFAPRTPGSPIQDMSSELLSIFGQLPPGDPDFDLLRITGGGQFGMPSPGHTTLYIAGGSWAVESYFDVTYRIDFIGNPGGALAGMSGSTTGTIRFSTPSTSGPGVCEHTPPSGMTVSNWYVDADADGYGCASCGATSACTQPGGYVSNDDDCDDTRADVSPGDPEVCDGTMTDENCDGFVNEGCPSPGCTDPLATNYASSATVDDGSCTYCAPSVTNDATLSMPIVIGSGIPNTHMAVGTECHSIEVGVSALERCLGTVKPTAGTNLYRMPTGYSPVCGGSSSSTLASWNYLVSVQLPAPLDFTDVRVLLDVDFDPGEVPVYHELDLSAYMVSIGQGGSHVFQSSENPSSPFWLSPPFSFSSVVDPLVEGRYDIRVRVLSPAPGSQLLMSVPIEVRTSHMVRLDPSVMLDGCYQSGTGLMRDDLRAHLPSPLIPLAQPYTVVPFSYTGTEVTSSSVLSVTGTDAVVDWIYLELRSSTAPATILHRRAALLHRDGHVTDVDGSSAVTFIAPPGDYHVAVRHRNHLGVMSGLPLTLSWPPTPIDFTDPGTPTYGTGAQKEVSSEPRCMWSSNVQHDSRVRYTGSGNDRDPILVAIGGTTPNNVLFHQYRREDTNMDGQVMYTGADNDREPILLTVNHGFTPVSATRQRLEQLP